MTGGVLGQPVAVMVCGNIRASMFSRLYVTSYGALLPLSMPKGTECPIALGIEL